MGTISISIFVALIIVAWLTMAMFIVGGRG
jgi:hypothetical protein